MENCYAQRRAALCRRLQQRQIAYALLDNPTNVYYLTGTMYAPHERFLALLLDCASAESWLVLPAMEQGRLQDAGITEIPYLDGEDHIRLLTDCLKQPGSVGLEKEFTTHGRVEAIVAQRGGGYDGFTDIGPDIYAQRLLKDEAEIAILQKACNMTDDLLRQWRAAIRPGVKESELRFELIRLVALQEGAEFSFETQISSAVNTSVAHGIRAERAAQNGEHLLIDYGVMLEHYHADITRCFFLAEPEAKLRELYEIVLEANLAGIAAVKPGRPIKEVDLAARAVIEKAGYGDYFNHRTGHGIGLEIHESPNIRQDNEALLQPGQTFTVEPGIYLPNQYGIRIEDDILVTEDGCRVLTQFPKQLQDVILG